MADSDQEADGYASANSGNSQGTRPEPPRKQDYIWLGENHCRAHMEARISGVAVPVVCPRPVEQCGYDSHQRKRNSGDVGSVGAYLRVQPPRGRTQYGAREGDPLTRDEYEALGDVDGVDWEDIAADLNDTDGTGQPEVPTQDAPIDNIPPAAGTTGPSRTNQPVNASDKGDPSPETTNPAGRSNASPLETEGSPVRGGTEQPRSGGGPPTAARPSAMRGTRSAPGHPGGDSSPTHWYGLEDAALKRYITNLLEEMNALVTAGFDFRKVFSSAVEAHNWKAAGEAVDITGDSTHSSGRRSKSPSKSDNRAKSRLNGRRPTRKDSKRRRRKGR